MKSFDIGKMIIQLSKLSGNYNGSYDNMICGNIIQLSKLSGNYNASGVLVGTLIIIQLSKLSGNYNLFASLNQ